MHTNTQYNEVSEYEDRKFEYFKLEALETKFHKQDKREWMGPKKEDFRVTI